MKHSLRFDGQVGGDQGLLAILPAADVEQVVLAGTHFLTERDLAHIQLVSPPGCPPLEDGDVAAVGVDVEVVGIEVSDDYLHAARFQYGCT